MSDIPLSEAGLAAALAVFFNADDQTLSVTVPKAVRAYLEANCKEFLQADPDDAEARERLEQENKRLREALDIAREGLLIVSGQSQCIDNLLSHEAVALEALRLIEEPGNAS